jgi:hypothetical protein
MKAQRKTSLCLLRESACSRSSKPASHHFNLNLTQPLVNFSSVIAISQLIGSGISQVYPHP